MAPELIVNQASMGLAAAAILALMAAIVIFAGSAMIRGANDSHDVAILHSAAARAVTEAQNAGSATVSITASAIAITTAPPYPHTRTFALPAAITSSQPFPITFTIDSTGIVAGLAAPSITISVDRTTELLYANEPFAFSP